MCVYFYGILLTCYAHKYFVYRRLYFARKWDFFFFEQKLINDENNWYCMWKCKVYNNSAMHVIRIPVKQIKVAW